MNSAFNKFVIFTVGAAIGSAVTWKYVKTKYEQIANDEIESMREYFMRRSSEQGEEPSEECVEEEEADSDTIDREEYADMVKQIGYTNYSNPENKGGNEKVSEVKKPYVVTPDEFGEIHEYETKTLFYYKDKVLADTDDEIVEDVDDTVGLDSLNHFGQYEDDSVFVRNEERETDYEILLDSRNYSDVVNTNPHQAEV